MTSFWSRVATVLSGSLAAQLVAFLAAPLLTRLYGPEGLGLFSIWLAWVSIAAIVVTLRLEVAVVVAATSNERRDGIVTALLAVAILTAVGSILAFVAQGTGLITTGTTGRHAILLAALAVVVTAIYQLGLAYAVTQRLFAPSAHVKLIAAFAIASGQLGWGWGGDGTFLGLVAGQCIGVTLAAALVLLWFKLPIWGLSIQGLWQRSTSYLWSQKDFVRFSLPADLINAGAAQMPLFLIGVAHGVGSAGLFALTQRALGAPVSLFAASVLDVFKQQATEDYRSHGNCQPVFMKTLRALTVLALVPMTVVAWLAPDLFAIVFGADWRAAGDMARLLAPLYFLRFVASPLSYVLYIAGKQRFDLLWQMALLSITAAAFLVPCDLDAKLLAYSLGYSALYIVYLGMAYQFSKGERLR